MERSKDKDPANRGISYADANENHSQLQGLFLRCLHFFKISEKLTGNSVFPTCMCLKSRGNGHYPARAANQLRTFFRALASRFRVRAMRALGKLLSGE